MGFSPLGFPPCTYRLAIGINFPYKFTYKPMLAKQPLMLMWYSSGDRVVSSALSIIFTRKTPTFAIIIADTTMPIRSDLLIN